MRKYRFWLTNEKHGKYFENSDNYCETNDVSNCEGAYAIVSNNATADSLPNTLVNCRFQSENDDGVNLSHFNHLTQLETLVISFGFSDEKIIQQDDDALQLPQLTYLNIVSYNFHNCNAIRCLNNLTNLCISSWCLLSDLRGIEHLTNLTSLDLYGNEITDVTPLTKLTKLTYLNLHSNEIRFAYQLNDLPNLLELDLGRNPLFISNVSNADTSYITDHMVPRDEVTIDAPNCVVVWEYYISETERHCRRQVAVSLQ